MSFLNCLLALTCISLLPAHIRSQTLASGGLTSFAGLLSSLGSNTRANVFVNITGLSGLSAEQQQLLATMLGTSLATSGSGTSAIAANPVALLAGRPLVSTLFGANPPLGFSLGDFLGTGAVAQSLQPYLNPLAAYQPPGLLGASAYNVPVPQNYNAGHASPASYGAPPAASSGGYSAPPATNSYAPAPHPGYAAPAPAYSSPNHGYAAPAPPTYAAPAPSAPASYHQSAPAPTYQQPAMPNYAAPAVNYPAPSPMPYSHQPNPSPGYQLVVAPTPGVAFGPPLPVAFAGTPITILPATAPSGGYNSPTPGQFPSYLVIQPQQPTINYATSGRK